MKLQHPKIIKNNIGFTLVELLVTIAILGVLSSIAVVVYKGITAGVRDSQRIRDLQSIKQSLELYRSDQHYYPRSYNPSFPGQQNFVLDSNVFIPLFISPSLTNCTGSREIYLGSCTVASTYLQPLPKDSNSSRNYYYSALPANCNNTSATCTGFILCGKKEGTSTSNDLSDCSSLPSGFNLCGSAGNCDIGISSQ